MEAITAWESAGARMKVRGHELFVRDTGGGGPVVLFLHGFPTCSFDWRHVLPQIERDARCVLIDFLGYGLSDKPDIAYSLFDQADFVCDVVAELNVRAVTMVTHDMGDSVGGELCARAIDGTLPFAIERRVVTNGSIYMDLVQLSPGQQLLLALPDEALAEGLPFEAFGPSLASTFAEAPSDEELRAQFALVERNGGNRLLPRLIRYVEERRVHESRWTGGIENHPSPLAIVWGARDPIAVPAMAVRLSERTGAHLDLLEETGHYGMIENPSAIAKVVAQTLR
jgi:pimeloyl-ACP methyl ester carboxylesterase